MTTPDADSPRYAVHPALQFDYQVIDTHTGDPVGDITDRADARALADTLNAGGPLPDDDQ